MRVRTGLGTPLALERSRWTSSPSTARRSIGVIAFTLVAGTLAAGALSISAHADDRAEPASPSTAVRSTEIGAPTDARSNAKIELGRRLFFDPAVSRFGKTSCASCHDPEFGFSDPRRLSRDETGQTPRHSQTMLDLADVPAGSNASGFHWDGEFRTLREVLISRLGSGDENSRDATRRLESHLRDAVAAGGKIDEDRLARAMAQAATSTGGYGRATTPSSRGSGRRAAVTASRRLRSIPAVTPSTPAAGNVARRLEIDDLYEPGFRRAFGDRAISVERVMEALEAYMLSLRSTESPFDRYMTGNDRALGSDATRGFELFAGKAGCATCHSVPVPGKTRAFSDFAFRNTGVASMNAAKDAKRVKAALKAVKDLLPETQVPDEKDLLNLDAGRAQVSIQTAHTGSFKTANLRDVAKRGPYMHNGRFETLEDVVRYYNKGGTLNAYLDAAIKPLHLTDREVTDVVAFLQSLSGDERPALAALPEDRAKTVRLRVIQLDGKPLRNQVVTVRPVGDRFRGSDALPEPFTVTTNASGYVRFPFPASTHVALDAAGYELGDSRLLPDWTKTQTAIATPRDRVSVIIRGDGIAKLGSELLVAPIAGPIGPPPGRSVSFRRERSLGGGRVLYSIAFDDVTHFNTCSSASLGVSSGKRRGFGTFTFDASGGMTAMVDLRPLPRDERVAHDRAKASIALFKFIAEHDRLTVRTGERVGTPSRRR